MVGTNLELSSEDVAIKIAQRVDKREHLIASNRAFLLWLRQRTAKVRNRLFDSGSDHLRQNAADSEVTCIAVHDK